MITTCRANAALRATGLDGWEYLRLPLPPPLEQVAAATVEPLVQLGNEVQCSLGQDLAGAADGRRFGNGPRTVEHNAHCSTGSTQIE